MPNMPVARKVLMQQGGKCRYCGVQCHSRDPYHKHYGTVEHILPKSKGGSGHIDNLAISCLECNRRKGDRTDAEFMAIRGVVQKEAEMQARLKIAIGGLRSIAYGEAHTWPNCSAREVAKQTLKDCGGEKHGQ